MYYSLLGRDLERDVLPMMQRYGLGLTVWSPLAGGFLSGKYTPENLTDPDSRYGGFDILPFDKTQGFELVERMRAIAAAHGASVAQVAIAWLLARNAVTSVIIGATKRHQLDDNLGAADLTLSPDGDRRARRGHRALAGLSELVHGEARRWAVGDGARNMKPDAGP